MFLLSFPAPMAYIFITCDALPPAFKLLSVALLSSSFVIQIIVHHSPLLGGGNRGEADNKGLQAFRFSCAPSSHGDNKR